MNERKLKQFNCIDCGCTFMAYSTRALRCQECRVSAKKEATKVWQSCHKGKRRKARHLEYCPEKTIRETLQELEKYNAEHRTHLTYGQFVSKRGME